MLNIEVNDWAWTRHYNIELILVGLCKKIQVMFKMFSKLKKKN